MPRIWKLSALAIALPAALVLVLAACGPAPAQEPEAGTADTTGTVVADADTAEAAAPVAEPARRKHQNLFGVSLRGQYRIPLKVLKENSRDINDIFASGSGFDAGVRWYALDGMALSLRYSRGGLGITDNESDLARFPTPPGLQGDEYMQLDAYTFALTAYLGGTLAPDAKLNPYLVGSVSRYDWSFSQDGRDGDPYYILDTVVEGTDAGVGFGIGAEYPVTGSLLFEAEWTWNYVLTELEQSEGVFGVWTNTHYWQLAGGLIWSF